MLLTLRGGPQSLAPRAHRIPIYPMVFSTFLYRAFTAHFDLDIRLVHAPTHPHRALAPVKRRFQLGTVFHDPALDGRVVDWHPALLQEFFHMPIAQGIRQIPAHAHQNDLLRKMGPLEADHRLPLLSLSHDKERAYSKCATNENLRQNHQEHLVDADGMGTQRAKP